MEQEDDNHQSYDDALFDELALQVFDRSGNQFATVIGRYNLHPFRQAAFEFLQLQFDPVDGFQGVLARAHDNDAADNFSFTIKFGDTATHLGTDPDISQIPDPDRCSFRGRHDHNVGQVLHGSDITSGGAHHEFRFPHFDGTTANIEIGVADRHHQLRHRNVIGEQPVGINGHLILLDETTEAGNFRHPFHRGQLVAQVPVLNTAQLLQIVPV